MAVFKMRDSVPSTRYSPVCNVLRLWTILTQTAPQSFDTNGALYYIISGCVYISPAVFIYLWLYLLYLRFYTILIQMALACRSEVSESSYTMLFVRTTWCHRSMVGSV